MGVLLLLHIRNMNKLFVTFLFLGLAVEFSHAWGDRLSITWPWYYDGPMSMSDAISDGWDQMDSSCGMFGYRYTDDSNEQLATIYGSDGDIYGVQVRMFNKPSYSKLTPWAYYSDETGDYYAITFWFGSGNKDSVCSSKRSKVPETNPFDKSIKQEEAKRSGSLGSGLYYENGSSRSMILLPNYESSLQSDWVEGACFVSMGTHYWKDITTDMDCDDFFPIGIMYNDGELVTFLVNTLGDEPSSYWEHPDESTLFLFFKDVQPTCFETAGTLSTMHMFVTNAVWNLCL